MSTVQRHGDEVWDSIFEMLVGISVSVFKKLQMQGASEEQNEPYALVR
jgi:hypothetical protein